MYEYCHMQHLQHLQVFWNSDQVEHLPRQHQFAILGNNLWL
jgi:hypothetical protein